MFRVIIGCLCVSQHGVREALGDLSARLDMLVALHDGLSRAGEYSSTTLYWHDHLSTRPNISESNSGTSTRVPLCIGTII